jgi:hypothetical protein
LRACVAEQFIASTVTHIHEKIMKQRRTWFQSSTGHIEKKKKKVAEAISSTIIV